MAKTNFTNVDQYIEIFPEEIQERMKAIRKLIFDLVPEAEEIISYQIPCYKYKGYLIYYSAYNKHLTLSYPFSNAFLKEFSEDLKAFKISKSALQIPHNMPLPVDMIRRMVAFRKKENEENVKLKK
ncbi:MAG: iron chaperone [Leadbetterella sp.]